MMQHHQEEEELLEAAPQQKKGFFGKVGDKVSAQLFKASKTTSKAINKKK